MGGNGWREMFSCPTASLTGDDRVIMTSIIDRFTE